MKITEQLKINRELDDYSLKTRFEGSPKIFCSVSSFSVASILAPKLKCNVTNNNIDNLSIFLGLKLKLLNENVILYSTSYLILTVLIKSINLI